MQDAKDLIPWEVTDISIRPFDGYWSFNPSIHFDGTVWRCVLRCCDYAMPDGVTVRSNKAIVGQQTKNAMIVFDPDDWAPIQIHKMHERDDLPRVPTPHAGYEDMRLFRTDTGGLQGIAASLQRSSVIRLNRVFQTMSAEFTTDASSVGRAFQTTRLDLSVRFLFPNRRPRVLCSRIAQGQQRS